MSEASKRTTYECYVCGRKEEGMFAENVIRLPVGWEKDAQGRDRCPRHVLERPAFATLGDMIKAKQGALR